ncbi:protein shisa-4 [Xenopus laevis]|uniref:Protein shisa-4 n=2 Tax=Xenopus laevis TaxID=8355 RepID=A0A1L8GHB1_XENLA|nr:protein shisa-4 [Xenopus laevis]OCT83200.1 hypothetical protein XELAEV_18025737mg [Xenopus laevis]
MSTDTAQHFTGSNQRLRMQLVKAAATSLLLCLIPVPAVLADNCAPYIGSDFRYHPQQNCLFGFCAGNCLERHCGILPGTQLNQSQLLCIVNNFWVIIGFSIFIGLTLVASIISCICKCYLLGAQRQRSSHTNVTMTNIMPLQPVIAAMPSAGYQPVATHPSYPGQYLPPPAYPGGEKQTLMA